MNRQASFLQFIQETDQHDAVEHCDAEDRDEADQRRGAPEAQTLYAETAESIAKREENAAQRKLHAHNPSPDRRPDKKQRRDIIKFKHQ